MGERHIHLKEALSQLSQICEIKKVSPIYETPALLPHGAEEQWNRPFLNMVIEVGSTDSSREFLVKAQSVEKKMGRVREQRWGPRLIDIDLLRWDDEKINDEILQVPHPEIEKRSFVLDPLKDLNKKYIPLARSLSQHAPLWMAICNVTPDSFANGKVPLSLKKFPDLVEGYQSLGVHVLDIGGESTRPNAEKLEWEEEWGRIEPYLQFLREFFYKDPLKPKVSVDTYKASVAERAVEMGVDIINDVSGLRDTEMLSILKSSDVDYVLMHSLGVPANPEHTVQGDIIEELCCWLDKKLELFQKNKIDIGRIIFDPGIGFGKTALQSLNIIRNFETFHKYPVRLMVGHSRKSFMKNFSHKDSVQRDGETLGVSMSLIQKKVDILRVHNPEIHIKAHKAWNHVTG